MAKRKREEKCWVVVHPEYGALLFTAAMGRSQAIRNLIKNSDWNAADRSIWQR